MVDQQSNEMQDVLDDFIVEAKELLDNLDADLVNLEKTPNDIELLNKIFRSVHTIKGAAGFLGLQDMVEIVHNTESLLNKLRQNEMRVTPNINDIILKTVDCIKIMLNNLKHGDGTAFDIAPINALLASLLQTDKKSEPEKKHPAGMATHKKIGEILIKNNIVSEEQVEE